MSKLNMYSLDGTQLTDFEVSDAVFGIEPNKQVLHDAVVMQQASLRQGSHKVKNRSEVRGGGRKPWKQKGTGRARQGSTRSPQWRGGGVVFGPTPRSYKYNLNRKVRKLALRSALSDKVLNGKAIVLENFVMESVKTQDFIKNMEALNLNTKTLFVISANESYENAYLSMRNIPKTDILSVEGLNVFDILNADNLVMTQEAAKLAGEVLE
ncbi:MAG: 50S ribosomal protein L4 [Erysipelothrix sp.]|nr:50S ribosomal protein L4 [Erysipelothrix sp.]